METTLSGVEHRTTSEPDYMIELEQKLRTFRACDLERDQLLEVRNMYNFGLAGRMLILRITESTAGLSNFTY